MPRFSSFIAERSNRIGLIMSRQRESSKYIDAKFNLLYGHRKRTLSVASMLQSDEDARPILSMSHDPTSSAVRNFTDSPHIQIALARKRMRTYAHPRVFPTDREP